MVNKEVELLFGEDIRAKVEELLDVSLSSGEITKSFSTTSGDMLKRKLQEADEVRTEMQNETFRETLLVAMTNSILGMVNTLYQIEEDKEPSVRRKVIKYTAIDSLTCSQISMYAIGAYHELKQLEKGKEK